VEAVLVDHDPQVDPQGVDPLLLEAQSLPHVVIDPQVRLLNELGGLLHLLSK